jgi:hypothetical protein
MAMNADTLVNLLLEVSVLNVKDLDRELDRLASGVYDERGQAWLKRVGRYWVLNVDKLVSEPYALPTGKRVTGQERETPGDWRQYSAFQPAPGEQPEAEKKLADLYQQAGINPTAPNARFRLRDWASKQGKNVAKQVDQALLQASPEPRTSLSRSVLGQYAPKIKSWQRVGHGEANVPGEVEMVEPYTTGFAPFKSAKAKKAPPSQQMSKLKDFDPAKHALYGEPPSKEDVPGFVKGGEEGGEQFYHFDPVKVRQRELWMRLQDVVDLFNHMTKRTEDRGNKFFNGLSRMRPEDLDGFRNVINAAVDHKRGSSGRLTGEDNVVLAKYGDLELIQVSTLETAKKLGTMPVPAENNPNDIPLAETTWCTRTDHYGPTYLRNGPLFDIFKNGAPYMQFHLHREPAPQLVDVNDHTVNDPERIAEVAPLLANFTGWPDHAIGPVQPLKNASQQVKQANPDLDTSPSGLSGKRARRLGNLAAEFMNALEKGKLPEGGELVDNVRDFLASKGQEAEGVDQNMFYKEIIRRIGNLGSRDPEDAPRRPYRVAPTQSVTKPGPPMQKLKTYLQTAGIDPNDPKALDKLREWASRRDKSGDYVVSDEDRANIDSLFTRARPRAQALRAIFGESRARRLILGLA